MLDIVAKSRPSKVLKDSFAYVTNLPSATDISSYTNVINEFLIERQNRKFNELMTEFEKTDITKDFAKFKRINKRLDRLHNDTNYYLQLDEPGKEEQ